MGGALAGAFAVSGAEVTIWNRTREKAEALSGPRIRVAESVAETLSSSPLTIVSVADHELARNLVDGAGVDLRGKVVASTSAVTLDQAEAIDAVVSTAGGQYLDLAILGGASEVRSGAGVFLVSGDRAAYAAHREWFERIGTATYVDDVPGAAYVSGNAVIIGYLPMVVSLLQGLRICEQHEFSSEWFKGAVLEFYTRQIRLLLDLLAETPDPSAAEVEGSVDVMRDWAAELAALLRGMGLDSGMYDALHRLFAAASTAGHGDDAWTRIAEHSATRTGGSSPTNSGRE
ncbi:NAD(P)-binding domain-containing protein [Agromyces humatus]|uniref:NAD(P)-binding domain-containing protein n=2 Tax=Agromyces humatus TaxID=279573 RepID=A0ABN2KP26_9MICO